MVQDIQYGQHCTVPARLMLMQSKKEEDSTNEKCIKKVLCMVSQRHLLFVCIAKRPLRAFAPSVCLYSFLLNRQRIFQQAGLHRNPPLSTRIFHQKSRQEVRKRLPYLDSGRADGGADGQFA